ncbi:hypothetical protein Q5752_004583 [Cryptotrichosporon argae]
MTSAAVPTALRIPAAIGPSSAPPLTTLVHASVSPCRSPLATVAYPVLDASRQCDAEPAHAHSSSPVEAAVAAARQRNTKRNGSRARNIVRGRLPMPEVIPGIDVDRWSHLHCYYRPWGSCTRPPRSGSGYCNMHSCFALNADNERCNNPVADPQATRYCSTGWHVETKRDAYVAELLEARRQYDMRAEQPPSDVSTSGSSAPRSDPSPLASQHLGRAQKPKLEYDVGRWYVGRWTPKLVESQEEDG